jgi:hypothetical protein
MGTATAPWAGVRGWVRGWWIDGLLLAAFAALTWALAAGWFLGTDLAVADALAGAPAAVAQLAVVLNFLGQGGKLLLPLAVLLAVLAARRTRSARPFLVVVGAFVLTYVTVGPIKVWTARAAPKSPLTSRAELFNDDIPAGQYALGYPSGHVVNSIVWYGVAAVLLAVVVVNLPRWVPIALLYAPPAILFVTTTVTRYHWISDSVAGLLLGIVLHRLLARIPWDAIPLPGFMGAWSRPAGLTVPPGCGAALRR